MLLAYSALFRRETRHATVITITVNDMTATDPTTDLIMMSLGSSSTTVMETTPFFCVVVSLVDAFRTVRSPEPTKINKNVL